MTFYRGKKRGEREKASVMVFAISRSAQAEEGGKKKGGASRGGKRGKKRRSSPSFGVSKVGKVRKIP